MRSFSETIDFVWAGKAPLRPKELIMKTYLPKPDDIDQKWYVIDAEDKILGRLAVEVANILRGRRKAMYTPHIDTGDFVIIINADKVRMTGRKDSRKTYDFYSGHMGGRTIKTAADIREKKPTWLVENAVKGMMPRNSMARGQRRKLKVYAGPDHPHEAQQPEPLEL
jgi:large subunit ribosomal protein L13